MFSDYATGWMTRGSNSDRGRGKKFFCSLRFPGLSCALPSHPFSGYRLPFPKVNQLVRDVDHSPPSIAEVKNEWNYSSNPPICLQGVDTDSFRFFFTIFVPLMILFILNPSRQQRSLKNLPLAWFMCQSRGSETYFTVNGSEFL